MIRAFNNAGDGRSVERGGDDEDGSTRDGNVRDGELVDSRGREAEASTQKPASEREANGRKAALADFLLGLGNPDLAAMMPWWHSGSSLRHCFVAAGIAVA